MENSIKIKTLYWLLVLVSLSFFIPAASNAQQESVEELINQARALGMEQASLTELYDRAKAQGIEDQKLTIMLNSAVALAGQNLPADHIIQKALEGMSKGVPGNRIVGVLDKIQQATEQSAQLVEPWIENPSVRGIIDQSGTQKMPEFRNELIKSASKAIAQGIPKDVIGGVLSDLNDESVLSKTSSLNIITAIGILPDLPAIAAQPEVSRAFIVHALKGGFGVDELQKLPSALNAAQMRSRLPAASVIQGMANQLQGGIPASQVLQNLFRGSVEGRPPGKIPKRPENNPGRNQRNN